MYQRQLPCSRLRESSLGVAALNFDIYILFGMCIYVVGEHESCSSSVKDRRQLLGVCSLFSHRVHNIRHPQEASLPTVSMSALT